jgi:hypothetical protein
VLIAPAIGSVSRCSRPIASNVAGCCCRIASVTTEHDRCQPEQKSCCRQTAADKAATNKDAAGKDVADKDPADRDASHCCFCKSNRPQPAIPAEQRDESRGELVLVAGAGGQVPVIAVQETRSARSVGDFTVGLAARQALLCRWLI